jgi:hypothetical protein
LSSILGKAWLPALAIFAVFAMFAIGGQARTAYADIDAVYLVDPSNDELYDNDGEECDNAGELLGGGVPLEAAADVDDDGKVHMALGEVIGLCVIVDGDWDTVNAQASSGEFLVALCGDQDDDGTSFEHVVGNWDDECEDTDGKGTNDLTVYCGEAFDSLCFDPEGALGIIFVYECEVAGEIEIVFTHDDDIFVQTVFCFAEPDEATVTAKPTKVEIVPALGSVAHSEITIVVAGDDYFVDPFDTEIDISVPKCAIEIGTDTPDTTPLTDNWPADDDAVVSFPTTGPNADKTVIDNIWFHADYNKCTPGDVVVTVVIEVEGGADLVRTVTINVVGPPAFITATAAPDRLICGEKSTITVTVKDALQQNVSDNTQVELISNWGSVIAGTGATLGFPGTGPVNPLASSAAATYNGVAIAYLLTSNNHVGAYEVVAAAGGTLIATPHSDDPYYDYVSDERRGGYDHHSDYVPGAPITTQVTVTCSLPAAPVAPTVTAPVTGTGSITPPNTGDAGLASSGSNAMLIVIVGAAAFVLAGIASVSYARR